VNTSNAFRRIAPVIAASIVAGGVAYFAVQHSSSTASAGVAPAAYGAPPNGPDGFGGGRVAGEQRIQGTVTAKTAGTVTIKSASGTAT
jgi:hypothetical protein